MLYAVKPEEGAELAIIDALIEAGFLCVFVKTDHVEIRGYGRTMKVQTRQHEPFTREQALRAIQRAVTQEKVPRGGMAPSEEG